MSCNRGFIPYSRKALNEIPRGHNLDAGLTHELDGPGIDARDVWNRAARRVLHRDALDGTEQPAKSGLELIASRVSLRGARQVGECVLLDRMHQSAWRTRGRNQVVPSP